MLALPKLMTPFAFSLYLSLPPPPPGAVAGGAIIAHHSGTTPASIRTRSLASVTERACLLELERASTTASRGQVVRRECAKKDLEGKRGEKEKEELLKPWKREYANGEENTRVRSELSAENCEGITLPRGRYGSSGLTGELREQKARQF